MSGIKDLDQELINATRDIMAKKDRIGITDQDRFKRAVLGDEDEETVPELGKAAKIYQEMTPGQSVEVEEAKKKKVIGLRTPEKVKINPVVEASTIYQGIPNGEQGDIRVAELISYLGSRGHKHGQDFWWENGLNVNNAPVGLDVVKSLKAWNPKKYKDAAMDGNVIKWNTGPSSARAAARPSDQTETKKAPLEWGTDVSVNAYKNMTPGEPTDEGNRVVKSTIDAAKRRVVLANKKNPNHPTSHEYKERRKKQNHDFPDDIHRILTKGSPKTDAGRKWQAAYKQSLALNNSFIPEEAPPGDKAERFIRKNKADFKDRYGENWERVLYATAWKNFGESIEEAVSVDGRTKGYRAAVARILARNGKMSAAAPEDNEAPEPQDDVDVQQTDEGNRLIGATIEKGKKDVAAAKEAERKAAHTAMVKRLHAASGTKPNKPLRKSNQRGSTRTIKYNTSPEELAKSFRYDTLTGKKRWGESVEEGTNARQRGEVQSPGSKKEYDALSPEDKEIVDKRIANARKQSMSRQPGESPRNKRSTPKRKKNEEVNEAAAKRPMSAAQKARHKKHQELLKITGAKKSKAPRKKARGKTEISKTASRYEDIEREIEEDAALRAILDHPSHAKSAKKVRGGDSLSKPEHKTLASAIIGHLAKNRPGHLKRSGDHYEAGEEAIDDLNSSYSPNHGESIEEDRRGETFEVKYAMSKKGPIRVSKFNSHSDAHKFLAQVRKQGFKGMVVSPNFSKGVDRKTESVDFDEGNARNREERVYGSGASGDRNHGVEREDANTKRARARYRAQQLARARAAASNDVPPPKPAGSPEWFAWKRRQKQQNNEYVPEGASKPPPPLPKGMTQKDLEKLTPKQRAKIRNLAGKNEYPHAHRDSNQDSNEAKEMDPMAVFLKGGGKITKVEPGETAGRKTDWTKPGSGHLSNVAATKYKFPRSRKKKEEFDWEEGEVVVDEARSPKEQAEFEKQMKAFVKKGSVKKLKTRGVPKKAPQTRVRGMRPRPSSAGAESKIREEVIDEDFPLNEIGDTVRGREGLTRYVKRAAGRLEMNAKRRGYKKGLRKAGKGPQEPSPLGGMRPAGPDDDDEKLDRERINRRVGIGRAVNRLLKAHPKSEGKEYAISRTYGDGREPKLIRPGGKSPTQITLDKIEKDPERGSGLRAVNRRAKANRKMSKRMTESDEVEVSERNNPIKKNPRRELEIKKRNNAHKRYLETTGSKSKRLGVRYTESVSVDEMQSGSKQSKVEKTGTHSSNLSYVSGSKHAVGRSSKEEKKRASKEARQARKRRGFGESRVSITPEREAEIKKEVQADIEKERQAKKARDKKAGRYMDHWGNWRTKGKPNPADELTRDFNKESIDKEDLKDLMHKKDLDNRHRRKAERAAERTAKTKRNFGPNKPSETAMARALRIAQKKKRKK
jgi:hypothetical protein